MDVTDTLRNAAYITVGAALLGFQQAQVRRREATRQLRRLEPQLEEGRRAVTAWAHQLEGTLAPVLQRAEEQLPGAAKGLWEQLRSTLPARTDGGT